MKKLDRLRWITQTFGHEFVLPYRACYAWNEIERAIVELRSQLGWIGMRTDLPDGTDQGTNLPFVYNVDEAKAREVWDLHGENLVYIVCGGIPPEDNRCNVAVQRLGQTVFLVEWDDGSCAQRAWEHVCMLLEHAFVEAGDDTDHEAHFAVDPARGLLRTLRPRQLPARTSFERMVDRIVVLPMSVDPLIVYTVRQDGKIVIW